jgi:chromosome segregation protein
MPDNKPCKFHGVLAEFIEVESGWDSAVETVLGTYLEAVCIDNADQLIAELSSLSDESITLFETQHPLQDESVKDMLL